ncbi:MULTISPECIES: DUF3618 domain-containing protein [Pseudofrankia]|uniref:DUF3618 domain-containing protein n=1 Tax=Pseudofrankia TaxID=2994363 RepID=UPI000234BAC2|nr:MULTISPECIES: DUF3618 domain-containing protein [Pseudofrankia]OHV38072.1 hypothetical protein BCD49_13820 [Pseudofrankia sp. EUN1h]
MPQDPATIQRQIDETRAELAETIDAIADIVSPRRVAERAGEQVRAKVAELRARVGHGGEPLELAADGTTPPAALPAPRAALTAAPGAPGQASGGRTVRWGRVALAVGATTLLVVRTTRRRRHRRG